MSDQSETIDIIYKVERNVYNVSKFDKDFPEYSTPTKRSCVVRFREQIKSLTCKRIFNSIFPFYSILAPFYNRKCFLADILAGLTLSILHTPQGMAYGLLADLKPIEGLYTSFFPPLIYFFFGSSRHVSIGTFSLISLLVSNPIERLSPTFSKNHSIPINEKSTSIELDEFKVKIAATICLLSGTLHLLLGLLNLGSLLVYISKPLLGGFTCAAGLHVFASQINGLFGIELIRISGPGRLFYIVIDFFKKVHNCNVVTLIISAICIVILCLFKYLISPKVMNRWHFQIPIELIVLIIGTIVSYAMNLNGRYGVKIVGSLPLGFPKPVLPDVRLIPDLLIDSLIISFISLATTFSLVKLYADKSGYEINNKQELIALGLCNIISGFFRCIPSSGALARTTVAYGAGMMSQIASLVSCVILLLVLKVLGKFLEPVPMCVLAAIIVVSLGGILFQCLDLPKLYRISVYDMLIWLVAFFATVFINVTYGLLIGIGFSLSTVLYRTQMSYYYELGRLDQTDLYVDVSKVIAAKRLPKILMLKYGGSLYFANAGRFRDWVFQFTQVKLRPDPHKAEKFPNSVKNGISTITSTHSLMQRLKSSVNLLKYSHKTNETQMEVQQNISAVSSSECDEEMLKYIIIDFTSLTFVDMVGMQTLMEIMQKYKKSNISVLLTICPQHVLKVLSTGSIAKKELVSISFATVHDAVLYATSCSKTDDSLCASPYSDKSHTENESPNHLSTYSIDSAK